MKYLRIIRYLLKFNIFVCLLLYNCFIYNNCFVVIVSHFIYNLLIIDYSSLRCSKNHVLVFFLNTVNPSMLGVI